MRHFFMGMSQLNFYLKTRVLVLFTSVIWWFSWCQIAKLTGAVVLNQSNISVLFPLIKDSNKILKRTGTTFHFWVFEHDKQFRFMTPFYYSILAFTLIDAGSLGLKTFSKCQHLFQQWRSLSVDVWPTKYTSQFFLNHIKQ